MMKHTNDWKVTAYEANGNIIEEWIITDRTEHEAEKEAIADLPFNTNDWTLVKQ